jgi:hypothetical protein
MTIKRSLGSHIRGWFPQEPQVGIIRSTNYTVKTNGWVPLSFALSAALMIIGATASAYLGSMLMLSYQGDLQHYTRFAYLDLYLGLLNYIALGIGLFSAVLLLLRKYPNLAEALIAVVLAFGLATPLIFTMEGLMPENGLLLGWPMVAFSIITLVLLRLTRRKQNDVNAHWTAVPFSIAGVLMVTASAISAYTGIKLMVDFFQGLSTGVPAYYLLKLLGGVSILVVFGACLFAGERLLKRKQIALAAVLVSIVLLIELAAGFITDMGGNLPYENFAFRASTVLFSIITLLLVGLNYRNFNLNDKLAFQWVAPILVFEVSIAALIGYFASFGTIEWLYGMGMAWSIWLVFLINPVALAGACIWAKRKTTIKEMSIC